MATLSKIPSTGKWPEIANTLNQNFTHISQEMQGVVVKIPQFKTVEEAKSTIKNPYKGQMILIGSAKPLHYYTWNGSTWADTGMTFNDPSVDLSGYPTSEQMNAELQKRDTKDAEQDDKLRTLDSSLRIIYKENCYFNGAEYEANEDFNSTNPISIPEDVNGCTFSCLPGIDEWSHTIVELDADFKQVDFWTQTINPRTIKFQQNTKYIVANIKKVYANEAYVNTPNGHNMLNSGGVTIKSELQKLNQKVENLEKKDIPVEQDFSIGEGSEKKVISQKVISQKIADIDSSLQINDRENTYFDGTKYEENVEFNSTDAIPIQDNVKGCIFSCLPGIDEWSHTIVELDADFKQVDFWTQTSNPRSINFTEKTKYIVVNIKKVYAKDAYVNTPDGVSLLVNNSVQLKDVTLRLNKEIKGLSGLKEQVDAINLDTLNYYESDLVEGHYFDGSESLVNPDYNHTSPIEVLPSSIVTFLLGSRQSNKYLFELDEKYKYVDYWQQGSGEREVTLSARTKYIVANIDAKKRGAYIRVGDVEYHFDGKPSQSAREAFDDIFVKLKTLEMKSDNVLMSKFPIIERNVGQLRVGDDVNGLTLNMFLAQAFDVCDTLRFLHLSDTHTSNVSIKKASELLNANDTYNFGIITGDLELTSTMIETIAAQSKLFVMLGNHDTHDFFAKDQKRARDSFIAPYMTSRAILGDDEEIGSWWHKDMTIGKRNIRIISFDEYEYTRVGLPSSSQAVVYSKKQIDWFINLLKSTPEEYYIILAHHQPVGDKRNGNVDKFVSENAPNHYEYESYTQHDPNLCPAGLTAQIMDCYLNKKLFAGTYHCGDAGGTTMTFSTDFSSIHPAKFLFHLAGHTHWDVCEYLPDYPSQLMLTIDQARPQRYTYSDLPRSQDDSDSSSYCINDILIDFVSKKVSVRRIGAKITQSNSIRDSIIFDLNI